MSNPIEEHTFTLPGGASFTNTLNANHTSTFRIDFGNGMVETFNSGMFLTCNIFGAAAYLQVSFFTKGKTPEIAKFLAGMVSSGCTFAISTWESYQDDGSGGGSGGGGDDGGGGRSPNDTGGSNPISSNPPKTPGLIIKPAAVSPTLDETAKLLVIGFENSISTDQSSRDILSMIEVSPSDQKSVEEVLSIMQNESNEIQIVGTSVMHF